MLYFVRHGEASSSWDQSTDPGLSELGQAQAETAAKELAGLTKPIQIFSSPLARAQETAAPLARIWGQNVTIIPEIAEIPSGEIPFEERRSWLNQVMQSTWERQSDHLVNWRENILAQLHRNGENAVFFTHFMVLNTIVGAIERSNKIMCYRPDNCSILQVSLETGMPQIMNRGREATTVVR